MPSNGEEPLGAVDFHITFTAVGHIASDADVKAGASRGEFCVAVEVADYLQSPQRYLAACIYTVVQVDARKRVCAREHESYPVILAVFVGLQGFLKRAPREQVCAGCLAASPGRIRHLVGLVANGLPHHPLWTCLELFGDVFSPEREDMRVCVYCHMNSFKGGGPVGWGLRKPPDYQGRFSKSPSESSGCTTLSCFGSTLGRIRWTFSTLS